MNKFVQLTCVTNDGEDKFTVYIRADYIYGVNSATAKDRKVHAGIKCCVQTSTGTYGCLDDVNIVLERIETAQSSIPTA